ncbi:hypothetical protein GOQ27_15245 [Clostridium sp. D2Q-11]|uniref:Uncharacterized protein n=1 Tax=Anaeromonas frigoriresistens TaxID=2683708 RepID=A0A942ZA43_9FIRM|nr:hypothetical protein [Anaeromonas frigoriresistens]MBS4539829.1 hypothetical protein [Anaeromonas frigoriresistens]
MKDKDTNILEACNILIDAKLKSMKFNKTLEGKVTEVIDSSTYKVNINNEEYKIRKLNDDIYQVGDIVFVLIINNNFSNKVILSKRP